MLLALARSLPSLGCGSVIAVFETPGAPRSELQKRAAQCGVQVETVPCAARFDRRAITRIRELVETHRIDVLHTHGYKADVFGYAAARPNRFALVATCHNWPSRLLSMRAYAALDRITLRRFDRVATASEPVARILRRWQVPARKLKVIPNGVDMRPFVDRQPSLRRGWCAPGDRLIGFVGRHVTDKGGALLLEAAPAVLAGFPNARFVFVGEGPSRAAWEAQAAQLGIASRVTFLGARTDMPAVYASLDMVVLPSFQECMPMCLLEALAAARPVIATGVGAVPRLVIPGVTGLLFEPGDVRALSAAMQRLLREPDLANILGEHGRAHVARHFSSGVIAASYVELYREVLQERRYELRSPAALQETRS